MRLPLIRQINKYIAEQEGQDVSKILDFLEFLSESNAVKEDELDVVGEIMSNLYGAIEVNKSIQEGVAEKDALNGFMKRVMGSIDT